MWFSIFTVFLLLAYADGDPSEYIHLNEGKTFEFTSSGYPEEAPAETNLLWVIHAPPGGAVKLTCIDLRIPSSDNCKNGYLLIRDGVKANKYCGPNSEVNIVSKYEAIVVALQLGKVPGLLRCEAQSLGVKPGQPVIEETVYLSLYGDPYEQINLVPIPNNQVRYWIFETHQGVKIGVRCTRFWLSNTSPKSAENCTKESLYFDLGNDDVAFFCGDQLGNRTVMSHGNRLVMKLRTTDYSIGSVKCYAKATRGPHIEDYRNLASEEIDSSEFGVTPGDKTTNCNCGRANKNDEAARILYGTDASEHEFPWMVSLQTKTDNFHFCGGSILTPWHVISAAHCIGSKTPDSIQIVAGATHLKHSLGTQTVGVDRIIPHSFHTIKANDIAILITKERFQLSTDIGPVCLTPKDPKMEDTYVTAVGWGRMAFDEYSYREDAQLKKAHLRVVDIKSCSRVWDGRLSTEDVRQICTWSQHRDICFGDSGGPVVWLDPETNRYVLVGLPAMCDGCNFTKPSVHTAVHYFYRWIQNVISDNPHSDATICEKVG